MSVRTRLATDGFTLLELLVVITIVSLLAATAAVRLSSSYRRAQLRRAVEQVAEIDRQARQIVRRRERPVELRIDVSNSVFDLFQGSEASKQRTWRLSSPIALTSASTSRERRRQGEVVVRYDQRGMSDTYAVAMQTRTGEVKRLLIAGGSGQVADGVTPKQIEGVLRGLAKSGFVTD